MTRKIILSIITTVLLLVGVTVGFDIVKGDEEVDAETSQMAIQDSVNPEVLNDKEETAKVKQSSMKDSETKVEKKEKPEVKVEKPKDEPKDKVEPKAEKYKDEKAEVEKPKESKVSAKKVEAPKKTEKPKQEKKSTDVIIKEVKQGKWGSGSDRKAKLTAAGYDYSAIQNEINKQVAASKPAVKATKATEKTEEKASTAPKAKSKASYKANHIYVNGSGMPFQSTDVDSLQKVIDDTQYRWISLGNFNPSDNRGTYFGVHSHTGGSVIYSLGKGNEVIVIDGSGNPHVYIVGKVYVQNKQATFDAELAGNLEQEYIILQTSEPRVNGERNGNRHVIAYKK